MHGICSTGCVLTEAYFPNAVMRWLQVNTSVLKLTHNVLDICRIAPNVHVITAYFLNEPCRSPHTNAPGVARVRSISDLFIPLPLLLLSDIPKVRLAPIQRLQPIWVKKLSANTMCTVVVTFEVTITWTFSRARLDFVRHRVLLRASRVLGRRNPY